MSKLLSALFEQLTLLFENSLQGALVTFKKIAADAEKLCGSCVLNIKKK